MNKGNEQQNGRQLFVSQGSAPATKPRTRNASLTLPEYTSICRDFIWGICTKGSRCAYRHERDKECMKTILKFCHDFQNKTGCLRSDCTYLHTSREEQSLFLNTGEIPKVLLERYAAMSASSTTPGAVNVTYTGEGVSHPPRVPVTAFPVPPTLPKALRPVMPTLLVPPPPPPPVTVAATPVQPGPTTFSAPLSPPVPVLQFNPQIMSSPLKFDVSKPPPPLPQTTKTSLKRSAVQCEAGPRKARKLEESDVIDNLCDNCVQRQIRTELFRQDLQNFQADKDYKTDLFTKKCEDYEHGKLLMRSLVNSDLYHFLEDYIEEDTSSGTQTQDLSQFTQMSSLATGISTSTKPFMTQLLERVFDTGSRSLLEPPPTPVNNMDNPILKSLTSLARSRSTPVKKGTAEVFQTLLDLMCDRKIPDTKSEGVESLTNDILNSETMPSTSGLNSVMTGFTQLINSQKGKSKSPEVKSSIHPTLTGMPPTSYGNSVVVNPNTLVSSPPPDYVPFQPNIPPPNTRQMFSPSHTSITVNIPNTNPYNSPMRMCVSPTMSTRPTVASPSPPQQTGQNIGQYPGNFPMQPHFFPPFQ